MTTQIDGSTGVSKIQDDTATASKIPTGTLKSYHLGGGSGTGNLTQYTTTTTPLASSGVAITVTHGLGFVPTEAFLEYTCLTAEYGYSVGDVVVPSGLFNGSIAAPAESVWRSATQVGTPAPATGYSHAINRRDSAAIVVPTPANWSYRFRLRAA